MTNKTELLKAYWLKVVDAKGSVTIETGRYKGVMPNTVKAFAKANGFNTMNPDNGVWVVSK